MSGMTADVLNYSSRQFAQLPLPNIDLLKPHTGEGTNLQYIGDCSLTENILSMLGQYGHQHVDALQDATFVKILEQSTLSALTQSLCTNESEEVV